MRWALWLIGVPVALLLAGCGSDEDGRPSLLVFGASSLEEALGDYAGSFRGADLRTSFAGSDQLAAQIRQGAAPDLFASADTEFPARLHRDGLVERPRIFASNRLVVAVPADGGVSSLFELAGDGVDIVIGDPSVPVGAYARTVIDRLPRDDEQAILANVRSEEPEVSSVVAKLEGGAADAGFVYLTDVRFSENLRTVPIPPRLQPDVAYAAAVTSDSDDKAAALRFLDGMIDGEGAAALRRAGFLPPP